ncbi:MAG TPA: cytochrome c, partial [Phototrophicaceae bacterium]|nr:cytochrome c [Phototrophicaceae bacterium]
TAALAATAAPTAAATPVPATLAAQSTSIAGAIVPTVGVGELNLAFTSGKAAYTWACSLCHGADGAGVSPYANLPLSASSLVQARDDAGLLAFLTLAQPPVNPNVTFPHPYRGGYPPLTDDQIREVIAYLHTLSGANP